MPDRPRIAVIYTHFPHYRAPVFAALRHSQRYDFDICYDARSQPEGVRAGQAADRHLRSRRLGPLWFQFGVLWALIRSRPDGVILLGNPYIVTNWLVALLLRALGRPVLMWTHGWLRAASGPREWLRNGFYRLADGLLLYGERARAIGVARGFAPDRLHVIHNSLDYALQARIRRSLPDHTQTARTETAPYLLCVGRLVEELRLDLAIAALRLLVRPGAPPCRLIVVGDGPLRGQLEAMAAGLPVEFRGAIYDEATLGALISGALAVVSPGKVGLLAMHALAYGAPVVTHDDMARQMPEAEAIEPGRTGLLFRHGEARDLARVMETYAQGHGPRDPARAIAVIEQNYTAARQLDLIEAALDRHFPPQAQEQPA